MLGLGEGLVDTETKRDRGPTITLTLKGKGKVKERVKRMLGGVGVLYYLETIGLEEYQARGCKRGNGTAVAG